LRKLDAKVAELAVHLRQVRLDIQESHSAREKLLKTAPQLNTQKVLEDRIAEIYKSLEQARLLPPRLREEKLPALEEELRELYLVRAELLELQLSVDGGVSEDAKSEKEAQDFLFGEKQDDRAAKSRS